MDVLLRRLCLGETLYPVRDVVSVTSYRKAALQYELAW